ncbi:STAS domain-containing protein [Sorangium sp. So ce1153]|uniref:STAS domain-containing protein n=1 Tax=Sorangium sp. So ce1153 TaxID=3133333 RepID=UPI003F5E3F3E
MSIKAPSWRPRRSVRFNPLSPRITPASLEHRPVHVPIAPSILVMPIIGTMDAQRAGRFIESMLQDITERHARVVLVDVTGMAAVDAASAEHLVRAARAARLLGAEVVLVGITPAAARLMVEQGVDLGSVVTRSNLELGFAYALSKTGGQIVYRRSPHAQRA